MATESVSQLEVAAIDRKKMLKALKQQAEKIDRMDEIEQSGGVKRSSEDLESSKRPRIKFRNYQPADDSLQDHQIERPALPTAEEEIKGLLSSSKARNQADEVDLINLAPRKPDWDLKRSIEEKLEKLQRRTQRCIVEIIRDRLQEGNLATAVETVTKEGMHDSDSD